MTGSRIPLDYECSNNTFVDARSAICHQQTKATRRQSASSTRTFNVKNREKDSVLLKLRINVKPAGDELNSIG